MSDIQTKIKQNQDLGKRIKDILSSIQITDNKQKALLFTAFLKNGLSHFCSMNLLIEKKLYHSAFAFVRVFFDNILRGEYSIYILDDTKIDEMFSSLNDWKFVTKEMCQKLDEFFENTFFNDIRMNSYGMMCDFTHTSNNQIARWFNDEKDLIESNFTENEIINLLEGNFILMERFVKNYIAFMKAHNLLDDGVNL
jgi:hypothetical protein